MYIYIFMETCGKCGKYAKTNWYEFIWTNIGAPFFQGDFKMINMRKEILKWSTCAYSKVMLLHWDLATHLLRMGEGLRASDLRPILEKYGW